MTASRSGGRGEVEPAAGRRLACAGVRVSSGRSFTGRILTEDGINQLSHIAAIKKCFVTFMSYLYFKTANMN